MGYTRAIEGRARMPRAPGPDGMSADGFEDATLSRHWPEYASITGPVVAIGFGSIGRGVLPPFINTCGSTADPTWGVALRVQGMRRYYALLLQCSVTNRVRVAPS